MKRSIRLWMRSAILAFSLLVIGGYAAMSQESAESFKDELIDLYGLSLYDVLDDPAAYHAEVAKLPRGVPEIAAANMLIMEVLNGGFWQYFFNSYGITIDEAIRGLEMTQNSEYAALAREAAAKFPAGVPDDRLARMLLVGESAGDGIRFDEQDSKFYAVSDEQGDEYWQRFEATANRILRENAN